MKYVHMQLNIRVLIHSLWEYCFYPWEDTSQSKSYHSFVICVDHCSSCDKGPPGGGGHLGIFWVGMYRPGLQIGTPF